MIFCSNRSQSALTALRYCWTASLLLGDDTGTGLGTAECWVDEQAATTTQLLAAIAIARSRPMSHMVDATELALRLRSQFVAEPLCRRDELPRRALRGDGKGDDADTGAWSLTLAEADISDAAMERWNRTADD
jgi:hypothetical protein